MVYSENIIRKDDFLGSTVIELENRYFNKVRGRCGVPYRYSESTWRDHLSPSDLLQEICRLHNIGSPTWLDELRVVVAGHEYCHSICLIDIRPRKAVAFELRVIVYEAFDEESAKIYPGVPGNSPVPGNQNPFLEKPKRVSNKKRIILRILLLLAIVIATVCLVVFLVLMEESYIKEMIKSKAFPAFDLLPGE
ncbi:hypothetical protein HAZT_HAZT005174 [Hyalella azteca]|uniref:Ferlin dsRNA-binding domain-containing protein n=1 Tax=Hyalella azteca TaxID=294128 RepID=A0A6A0HDL8_HYAAZ|nr:hypothetical protein HAZT_HAZT005174 [Hyalella azteca]